MSPQSEQQNPVSQLEAVIARHADNLEKEAPDQLARMKRVVKDLKSLPAGTKAYPPDLQREVVELYQWQLGMQKKAYVARLEALRPAVRAGDAVANKAKIALEQVIAFMDTAISQAAAPSPKTQQALEQAAARAREALKANEAEFARQAADATVRPLPKVSGASQAPSPLEVFRVLPGASAPRPTAGAPTKAGPAKKAAPPKKAR